MNTDSKQAGMAKRKGSASAKPRPTAVEVLSSEDLRTLRLNEADALQFERLCSQIKLSREDMQTLEVGDISTMDDARYDLLTAAQARMTTDTTAMVHFLAPRVMKLRDGEAKRKWRSFVTKFQKDSKIA